MGADLTDIVNATTAVFTLVKSNVTMTMSEDAHAVPRGVDVLTGTTGWNPEPARMVGPVTYPAMVRGTDWHYPLVSDTVLHLGVIWTYGGQVEGRGRFIKDAKAFVVVDSVTIAESVDVDGKFASTGTPIGSEPVALLTGTLNLKMTHALLGLEFSEFFGIRIFGNGSGDLRRIT